MSARSPFRSHLLQQWTNSRRSPIVVQQWLRQATIDEEEEGVPSSAPTRSSRHRREHSRRSLYLSSRQQQLHPDLSSVDSSPSTPSIALAATKLSTGVPLDQKDRRQVENALRDMVTPRNIATNVYGMTYAPSIKNKIRDHGKSIDSLTLKTAKNSQKDKEKDRPELQLAMAIGQAVKMALTINVRRNHDQSRTEEESSPFTFRKLRSSSRSGRQLIDICFEVALRTTSDDAFARNERETWSEVPAFLVAIVHDNQSETPVMATTTTAAATTTTTTNVVEKYDDDNDPYKVLGYSPPVNEGQLEDYASACAAVQSVIHSLDGDGFGTEWVTGSLIKTPAFRSLVKAKPTDRIAALIKVHDRPTRCEKLSSRQTEDDVNHV